MFHWLQGSSVVVVAAAGLGIISLKYLNSFVVVVKDACSSPLLPELIINLALFIKLSADNLCALECVWV